MSKNMKINATVNQAMQFADHSKEQWDRFYFITKEEAKMLSEAHTEWTRWILIPANEKDNMLKRINERLVAERIPEVEMIVLKWRMSQLLRDIQRKYTAGTMFPGPSKRASGSSSKTRTREYDPVRDV
ncbi:hypothetical protein K491DRAFT_704586 [Lophiostoma macrostomum CBS 122681]|uniref:Uncharacterized protein n=1 Tax=Lophiostoma macrostomum CBS 122681 TaxID=1314788 RepID=A0A6A6T8G2_9PLEO|nr:hypothetical protein K491DRAFT_704586 [Lophiostoma macrostomum CBS 122681]